MDYPKDGVEVEEEAGLVTQEVRCFGFAAHCALPLHTTDFCIATSTRSKQKSVAKEY